MQGAETSNKVLEVLTVDDESPQLTLTGKKTLPHPTLVLVHTICRWMFNMQIRLFPAEMYWSTLRLWRMLEHVLQFP